MRHRRASAARSGWAALAALVGASSTGSQPPKSPREGAQAPPPSAPLYRPEDLEAAARRVLHPLPHAVSDDVADLLCKPGILESFEGSWRTAANFTHDIVAPHPPLISFTVESQSFSFRRSPLGFTRCFIFHTVKYPDVLGELRDSLGRIDVVYGPEGDGLKGKGFCSLALLDQRLSFGDGRNLECEYTFLRRRGWLLVKLSYKLMGMPIYREYPLFRPEPGKVA